MSDRPVGDSGDEPTADRRIKELFDPEGLAVTPLAPSEVRRRGDRLRHRRRAAGVVAGLAVVALVAAPFALITGGDDSSSPSPAPPGPTETATTPSDRGYLTSIPSPFPIDLDLQRQEDGSTPTPSSTPSETAIPAPCNASTSAHDEYVDLLSVVATYPAEGSDGRDLRTYASDHQAAAALAQVRRAAEDCATQPIRNETDTSIVWTLRDLDLGDEGFTLVWTFEEGLGGVIYQLVRVGNAVLVTQAEGEWELTSTVPIGIGERTQLAAKLVGKMCIFSTAGCAETAPTALSPADLITPEETQPRHESAWETLDTSEGEGDGSPNPCFTETLAGRGATAVFRRDFGMVGPQGPTEGDWMTAMVAEFPDSGEAAAAYDNFGDDVMGCRPRIVPDLGEESTTPRATSIALTNVGGEATAYWLTFGPFEGSPDAVTRLETGLALVGDRLVLLTTVAGPFEPGDIPSPTAMEAMLVQAAERLVPGPEGPITPVTPMV